MRRATEVICQFYLRFYAQSIYLKGCQESVSYSSVALCAIGTSLTLHSSPSTPCLRVPYYVRVLDYHSIFRKNHFSSHVRLWMPAYRNLKSTTDYI